MAENASDRPENRLKETVMLLGCVDREHRALIEAQVEQLGVHRTQHMLPMYVARNEGAAQRDIARAFDVSPSAIAVSLKKLEAAGLVERVRKEGDDRTNSLFLTGAGRELVCKSRELFREADEAMFAGFTEAEVHEFTEYLLRLKQNIKRGCGQPAGCTPFEAAQEVMEST